MKATKLLGIILMLLVFVNACKKDDPKPTVLNPFSAFEISTDKNIVKLINKSQNGTTHAVYWGDNNSECIGAKDTVKHTYAELGSFIISLKVTNSNGDNSTSKTAEITEKY